MKTAQLDSPAIQLSLFNEAIDPAEEAARRLIRPYVKRGDDPQWIKCGHMGHYGEWRAHIGGYCDPFEKFTKNRNYSSDYIIVNRDVNGKDGVWVFNFWKIYRAVQQEA
jgi:hypothetical protein